MKNTRTIQSQMMSRNIFDARVVDIIRSRNPRGLKLEDLAEALGQEHKTSMGKRALRRDLNRLVKWEIIDSAPGDIYYAGKLIERTEWQISAWKMWLRSVGARRIEVTKMLLER